MIRIAESFLYSDVIAGSEPDVEKAVEAVRVLLHAPPLPPRMKVTPPRGSGRVGKRSRKAQSAIARTSSRPS